jgi:transposase
VEQPFQTRAVVVPLDPTPAQQQLLRSYCGAARFAYNWTIGLVKENLDVRTQEREEGVSEHDLTTSLSWTQYSMTPLWNSLKDDVAPWHHDVTLHAFRSGVTNATVALSDRVFECSTCGIRLDRNVNAARNIHREGVRLLGNETTVAGHQPKTRNADSRDEKTKAPRCDGGDRYQSRTTQPIEDLSHSA